MLHLSLYTSVLMDSYKGKMAELEMSIPDYSQQSGFSTLLINPSVVDSTLKIVTYQSNNCLFELKGQKIFNSLKLNGDIKKVGYAYLIENDKLVLFYVVLTSIQLFIVKRSNSCLEVVKVYDNVEDFHVHDFMCLGYPQAEIEFTGPSKSIIKLPIDDVQRCMGKTNLVAKDLAEKLQTVCRHVEGLSVEWDRMRDLLEDSTSLEEYYTFPVSSLKFFSPQKECTDEVTVTSRWKSMIGDKLILGMEIQNKGKKVLSNLEFNIYEKSIKEYSYSFFSMYDKILKHEENALFSTRTKNASVASGEKISIFGAIPKTQLNFAFRTKILVTCYVISGKLKDYLVKETFEITFEDVLVRNKKLFTPQKKSISLKSLQTIQVAKTETRLKIQAKYLIRSKLEKILLNNLKFTEVFEGEFYYSDSPYLNEVFVFLPRGIKVDETIWKIILYTSDDSQVYYIVNMLLEFLPEYATIVYDDDE